MITFIECNKHELAVHLHTIAIYQNYKLFSYNNFAGIELVRSEEIKFAYYLPDFLVLSHLVNNFP